MAQTDSEKRKAADIAKDQAAISKLARSNASTNPLYNTNPSNPNSYLPYAPTAAEIAANPTLADVLPRANYNDPKIPTPASLARAKQVTDVRNNARQYVEDNALALTNEQSLLDKGKTIMGRIFDYKDEADASILGMSIAPVESFFDGFVRHFVGGYDLLNVGFGGIISAMPGGVRTLSYDELSGGKSVGEVWNGEMVPGSAPSPGQIAVASVAKEAKRIREGGARLTDVLLLNPATAPFILAGLKAETSPLQADNFDIMNQEQRTKAFSSGWEQWMSGVTDFGLSFADPLVGVGVVGKVARKGLLGALSTSANAKLAGAVYDDAMDVLTTAAGDSRSVDEIIDGVVTGTGRSAAQPEIPGTAIEPLTPQGLQRFVEEPPMTPYGPAVTKNTPMPDTNNPVVPLFYKLSMVDEAGNPVMPMREIENLKELEKVTLKSQVVDMLYRAKHPVEVGLIFGSLNNVPGSIARLQKVAPAMAEQAFAAQQDSIRALVQLTEPAKKAEAVAQYSAKAEIFRTQIKDAEEIVSRIAPDGKAPVTLSTGLQKTYQDAQKRLGVLQKSLDEVEFLARVADGREVLSPLDPASPFFNLGEAQRIVADLETASDAVGKLLRKEINDELAITQMTMPLRPNAYSRAVASSRLRRARAAYEFGEEGTSIFPKTRKIMENGVATSVKSGWLAPSEFAGRGTGRFQRNARVWRYAGQQLPSGYIGLKGTATVGSEEEFRAALNLDIYKGKGIQTGTDANGVPIYAGGAARRDALTNMFYEALNNPNMDSGKALWSVEEEIMKDFEKAYNLPAGKMKNVLDRANKRRSMDLDMIRVGGYFLDDEGTRNYVPWLETHLANGTYMHNFHELEKILHKEYARDGGSSLLARMDMPLELAGSAYDMFNSLWRPATLLRLSYTQRNVVEGMVRAMAFQASLAPLSWPVRATAHGVGNLAKKKSLTREVSGLQKKLKGTKTGTLLTNLDDARDAYHYLESAVEITDADGVVTGMMGNIRGLDGKIKRETMDIETWAANRDAAAAKISEIEAGLAGVESEFTASVKGTKFGKWREKEIKALIQRNDELTASRAGINEAIRDLEASDPSYHFADDAQRQDQLAELNAHAVVYDMQLHALRYRPGDAISMYRGIAGRQKRIGSGMSLGPDGTYYGDAFADSLDLINRNNLSSDNTFKSVMSLRSDVYDSIFKQTIVRHYTPVEYGEDLASHNEWLGALQGAIEDASSSRIVRVLMDNEMNIERTVDWMLSGNREATVFTTRIMSMFADENVSLADVAKTVEAESATMGNRLTPFAEKVTSPSGISSIAFDRERVTAYVQLAADNLQRNMQNNADLFSILERRIQEKTASGVAVSGKRTGVISGVAATGPTGVTTDELRAIVDQMDEDTIKALSPIIGSEAIHLGTDSVARIWAKFTNKAFKYLGTMPEDAVVRGPFYNTRFKAVRNQLIEGYWQQTKGMSGKEVRAAKKANGADEGMTVAHDEFKIPANELSRIEVLAHRRALKDTKEWMFTIDRQTNLGKYGEWIFPFISAQQNSVVTIGKLLWKEPWLAPMVTDLWRAPDRLGWTDENGDIKLPMPMHWIQKTLDDHPDFPILGGVLDSKDVLTIPKNGLNVWMPETGFGMLPTPSPWVAVTASELMKRNAFPVEAPEIFKSALGEEGGTQAWKFINDYVFGEEGTVSSKWASYDKLTPAWMQRLMSGFDEMSTQYGYQYATQFATQEMRAYAGERDSRPTSDEIAKRTTNLFWFYALGNLGVPTPLTPMPIMTRPTITKAPVEALRKVYEGYQAADPKTANLNMDRQFSDFGLNAALTKATRNVGGANANAATVSDIEKFDSLIREVVPQIGSNNYNVLGILVNNRGSSAEYEDNAYAWEKTKVIAGTGSTYRQNVSPEEAIAERQRIIGWTRYRAFMDQLTARLQNAGLDSFEVSAAAPFKAAKDAFIQEAINNPDLAGWVVDYQDIGGNRIGAAVRTIEAATKNSTFRTEMMKSGKESVLGAMDLYLQHRDTLIYLLEQSGHGIEWDGNSHLKQAWAKIRTDLENSSPRWQEISSLYLAGDDNPRPVGTFSYPSDTTTTEGMA